MMAGILPANLIYLIFNLCLLLYFLFSYHCRCTKFVFTLKALRMESFLLYGEVQSFFKISFTSSQIQNDMI